MNRLFCYGTLQVPDVIKAVTGQTYPGLKAALPGYAIYRVENAEYPGIIRSADGEVEGIIYDDVDDKSLKVLDLFEGDLYRRQLLDVKPADDNICKAWCYVIQNHNESYLTGDTWRLEDFLKNGLQSFMKGYVRGRRDIYDL